MRERRGSTVEVKCQRCGCLFHARLADRRRGWGKFCSKSCKAIKQEQRTGQHSAYLDRKYSSGNGDGYMHPSMAEGEVQ